MSQLAMEFEIEEKVQHRESINLLPLDEYDHILLSISGGKDSVACAVHLDELGVDPSKLEFWHQSVDGGQSDTEFLDWPVTESYVQAIGELFNISVSFQWREGGIYGEMMRKESLTGDVYNVDADGEIMYLPTRNGKRTTRGKWPAMSPDLRVRWCSAYVKIDVFRRVLNNHPKYQGTAERPKKILVVSGERREESPNRAQYAEAEEHACNSRNRIVHAWRPVIDWSEKQIWDAFEKRKILPHPAYLLGWNRTSCLGCIFSTPDLWAMMREIAPGRFSRMVAVEKELHHTVDPKMDLTAKANQGSLKRLPTDARTSRWAQLALHRNFNVGDLRVERWELPAGAFRGSAGGPS